MLDSRTLLGLTQKFGRTGLTQKSLDRLFPVDTSMVVIIDDRSDVWENSPNLVPVVPCASCSPPRIHITES